LVRRLLENGANSSFVNQIVDEDVPPAVVAACPFDQIDAPSTLPTAPNLFSPQRPNSKGWDLTHTPTLAAIDKVRDPLEDAKWDAAPLLSGKTENGTKLPVTNPSSGEEVGTVIHASKEDVQTALSGSAPWDAPASERADVLRKVAALYEQNAFEIFALVAREAGKSLPDAVGEVREAVDFLYYYASGADDRAARGTWTCISPWNFPLAIFTGQISAALAAGNAVLAKPAEQTPLIAAFAVRLMHEAGVPRSALQLLPGGGEVGAGLVSDARVNGVAFTGSTATAQKIRASMAAHCVPGTPLIAETGGLNAMIVDSTALPEHAVRDILWSSFRSAGQRCSALRCLYVQEDIADTLITMLKGAMDELTVGDPWYLSTDIGPVIDRAARDGIAAHIDTARHEGRIIHELATPSNGTFIAPTALRINGIADLDREIFGPVLHIATFKAEELSKVIEDINATGYGLTFGLHTRIDGRVQTVVEQIKVGNVYVNRNQIGAVVGSQPFGGEGLSGTGPKAGGPHYQARFRAPQPGTKGTPWEKACDIAALKRALAAAPEANEQHAEDMPGPTGESNRLTEVARGPVLCLGPDAATAAAQVDAVVSLGGIGVAATGFVTPNELVSLPMVSAVVWWGDEETGRAYESALAQRKGPIVSLITAMPDAAHVNYERHVCIDTTAAGGNAALLAEVSG